MVLTVNVLTTVFSMLYLPQNNKPISTHTYTYFDRNFIIVNRINCEEDRFNPFRLTSDAMLQTLFCTPYYLPNYINVDVFQTQKDTFVFLFPYSFVFLL